MLLRSLAVLAWDSQRFPWNLRACCSTLTPSLSITWLGRWVWDPYSSLSVCTCVKCLFLKYSHSLSFFNCSAFMLYFHLKDLGNLFLPDLQSNFNLLLSLCLLWAVWTPPIRRRRRATTSMWRWMTHWKAKWTASCPPRPTNRRSLHWRWR